MNNLYKYGSNARFESEATLYPHLIPARVTSQYKDLYKIITSEGELLAEVSGKFRYEATRPSDYPAVGDFIMADRSNGNQGNAIIHQVLTRKSVLERTAAGENGQSQLIAANIDFIFLCMSLNNDYNLSRLERYLSAAWSSGATPVVVLTKSDLCENLDCTALEISKIALGADIVFTSMHDPDSVSKLLPYLKEGITASFIGSSGVGKSTLVNSLAGQEIFTTSHIRNDDKGRHTTTRRELYLLPQGGIIIDTPGMREFGIESADFSKTFADIEELLSQCKFGDCSHTTEPGCAIRKAMEEGNLDRRRFESFQKLEKEAKYEGLSSKQIETEKLNTMFGSVGGMKKARDFINNNNKRR